MPDTHIMVDIETLGTSRDSPILTIGAVVFDPNEGTVGEKWYRKIDVKNYDDLGHIFTMNYGTLLWWLKQKMIEEAFLGPDRIPVETALQEFSDWLKTKPGTLYMWSHGKEFDLPILDYALTSFNIETPWKFWNTRDTRTVYDIASIKLDKADGYDLHHAVGDCLRQIEGVIRAYKKIYFDLRY